VKVGASIIFDIDGPELVIPLKEVLDLIQRGLMNVAMAAFTKVAECVMGHEVTALVGAKNQANASG
jgi:putative transposase